MESKRTSNRTPINGTRNVLNVKGKDPKFQYRIVNDEADRVSDFQDLGYEIVTHDVTVGDKRVAKASQQGSPVVISVGGGMKAVLMRKPLEEYEADQRVKAADVDASEEAITSTLNGGDYGKVEIRR